MDRAKIARRIAGAHEHQLDRIARRVARLAFGTLHLRETMLHVDPDAVKGSDIPDDLKRDFSDAFEAKKIFFKSIPMDRHMLEDDRAVDRMDKKAGSLVFALQSLAAKMREHGFRIDGKTEAAIKDQARHGFVPGPGVGVEANDWAWNAHEIISKLYDIASES